MAREGNPPASKTLLPLLAVVLLLAGACGAPAATERQPQTSPTTAGEGPRKLPASGAGETSPPDRNPDLTGTVTEVRRGDEGSNPFEWILVEEDPGVEPSAGPNTEGWEKLFFEVTDETRIFARRGGGEVVPATAADLAEGQMVDAWHGDHAVMESYPGQTVASEVMIHGPPPARSAVFFPVQAPEPADMMTAMIRGELTLDGEGCLHVEEPKSGVDSVPVWPAGFGVATSGDEIRVLNGRGRVVGKVGEQVLLGGGEIPVAALGGNDLVEEPLLRELLGRCPGDYWLVAP